MWVKSNMQDFKIEHLNICIEYIRFCLSKGKYDCLPIKKLYLMETITRIFLYFLVCYNMICGVSFLGVFELLVALFCSFLNMVNFIYTLLKMLNAFVNEDDNEEVL